MELSILGSFRQGVKPRANYALNYNAAEGPPRNVAHQCRILIVR